MLEPMRISSMAIAVVLTLLVACGGESDSITEEMEDFADSVDRSGQPVAEQTLEAFGCNDATGPEDAAVGTDVTVRGRVVDIGSHEDELGAVTLLRVGGEREGGEPALTLAITERATERFPALPASYFEDAVVCARGSVTNFLGVATMFINGPEDIVIVESA
jgi:hypothetical protein